MGCKICGSYAINPHLHDRQPGVDLDLCDVCYWKTRVPGFMNFEKENLLRCKCGAPARFFSNLDSEKVWFGVKCSSCDNVVSDCNTTQHAQKAWNTEMKK